MSCFLPTDSQIPRPPLAPNILVEPKEWFSITISDIGCGIPAGELKKVLDPFYTTKRRDEGTGVGLSITNTLIQRHGGCMKIESTVGTGTNIRLYLPLAKRPIVRSWGIAQPIPTGMLQMDFRNRVPATGS
ncbi:ATP-binding protein [Roseimaritima multifibrata]|uniref:ATP-binding protein n=1 Tax=Roseimaritima multifibrata TaxID=1930274 RepID=UPI001C54F700|nr:ATP-binding protein [Roseimaritima multifibrata]